MRRAMERDSIDATGSGNNFRSGQTRFHADRTRSTSDHAPSGTGNAHRTTAQAADRAKERGMSVRLVDQSSAGYPPCRSRRARVIRQGTARNLLKMTPSRRCLHLRAHTSRCGLRLVSERTPHEEGGSANRLRRRTRVIPRDSEVVIGGNIDDCDGNATDLRGIIRRMVQTDEEHVGFPRQLGSRAHRTRTRHGARLTDPREIVEKQWMGRTRMRWYADAERR